jgi:exopolysaccharide biosynthesis protein
MKKNTLKKVILIIFALAVAATPYIHSQALPETIYEEIESSMITAGVRHDRITRFTSKGWLNINVIRANLSSDLINVDTMVDSSSIQNLSSPLDLVRSNNAVAAINGSFFIWTDEVNKVIPIGPGMKSGSILTADSSLNISSDTIATFSVDKLKNILCSYWKTSMWVEAPNKAILIVGRYNRPYYNYTDLTVLDSTWGAMSPGVSPQQSDIVEMVVENNTVIEIREQKPAVAIPKNGYVIVTRADGAKMLLDNFKVGDRIEFHVKTTPDWENITMAVSGGAILVKNGRIPDKFTHEVSGSHPRSAIGCTKDRQELIMVTVDGRQDASFGLTQREMAELLVELGAYDAINLDGGGSTSIIARPLGMKDPVILNSPSDGVPRQIPNMIGITTSAPESPLYGLIVETDDTNIFAGTSREFSVRGYDRYFNPVTVDPDDVAWSISGVKGDFAGNVLYPQNAGRAVVTATVGSVTGEIEVNILEPPVKLVPDRKIIRLANDETAEIKFYGKDNAGTSALIRPADIGWQMHGITGEFKNGIFKPFAQGSGYMDTWVGDTHAYIEIHVPSYTVKLLDDFERLNGSFLGYPSSVIGSYEISSNHPFAGSYSGKMQYNFISNPDVTRAAYLVFDNGGIPLDPSTVELGLEVYNTYPTSCWLRAEIYDTNGVLHRVDFVKELRWTKWQHVEAKIEGFVPARLTRIYLAQVNRVQDIGGIYLDNLTATVFEGYSDEPLGMPPDTEPEDPDVESVAYTPASDTFRFSVFSQTESPRNPLETVLTTRMAEKINNYIDFSMLIGNGCDEIKSKVEKPQLCSSDAGFKTMGILDAKFFKLDTRDGSLRTSSEGQWRWFINQFDAFTGKQAFIILDTAPDKFTDKKEGELFRKILADHVRQKGTCIWVFCPGEKNTSYMEDGVKYVEVSGFAHQDVTIETLEQATYALITVRGDKVTYEFKPIL